MAKKKDDGQRKVSVAIQCKNCVSGKVRKRVNGKLIVSTCIACEGRGYRTV